MRPSQALRDGLLELRAEGLADGARLAAVQRILRPGPRASSLDRITRLAAELLDVPHAQVSLLAEKQYVWSRYGGPPSSSADSADGVDSSPVTDSPCGIAVALRAPLAVSDALVDQRTATLPTVTRGVLRSYLGVPLVGSGEQVLGTLCVYDTRPRQWDAGAVGLLGELAQSVVAELELRALSLEAETDAARLELALQAADIGSYDIDLDSGRVHWDDRLLRLFGVRPEEFSGTLAEFDDRLHADDRERVAAELAEIMQRVGDLSLEYRIVRPDGGVRWVEARGRVLPDRSGRPYRLLGVMYDATRRRLAELERERAVVERERAYASAEAANQRLSLLADVSTTLAASLQPLQVLETFGQIVVPALGQWTAVALTAETAAALTGQEQLDPDVVVVVHVEHAHPEQAESLRALLRELPLTVDSPAGVGAVIRTGEPEWLPEVPDELLARFVTDQVPLERLREIGVGAALSLPLVNRGRVLGAVTVAEPASGPLDRALLADLVRRAAVALDNALVHEEQRRTALTLQRSLLPRELPRVPGVETATEYLPGAAGAYVGGDWYQGVRVGDRLLLAMGDVMGHGMRSAARMGQLRAIVAALALEGHRPGDLLARLADSVEVLLDLELATLLVADLDTREGVLCVATAGHPPPLLVEPGTEPRYLDVPPGPPLGTLPGSYEQVEVRLAPGSTLVLYTDGLVEQRDASLDDGLERLRRAVRHLRLPPAQVRDHVLDALGRRQGGEDDVALLVARWQPPADPS